MDNSPFNHNRHSCQNVLVSGNGQWDATMGLKSLFERVRIFMINLWFTYHVDPRWFRAKTAKSQFGGTWFKPWHRQHFSHQCGLEAHFSTIIDVHSNLSAIGIKLSKEVIYWHNEVTLAAKGQTISEWLHQFFQKLTDL